MSPSPQFFNPSEAARRLGVSTKALRHYEERGLITPIRTEAGWRTYGPEEMARAGEVVTLRQLGLSIAQVAQVMDGDPRCLEIALAEHQTALQDQAHQLAETIARVTALRANLAQGRAPDASELGNMLQTAGNIQISLTLPWPWGGERFELRNIRPLTYIIGPLGAGKTQLSMELAKALPGGAFVGLDRLADESAAAQTQLRSNGALKLRVDQTMAWLAAEGAAETPQLTALLVALEARGSDCLVIDLVEQDLDQITQEALIAHLRRRAPGSSPLFLMTRSSAILDMAAVGPNESIILCPANHSPPSVVAPYPGSSGYEAVSTCLASPAVRARTEGVIAWRPQRAKG